MGATNGLAGVQVAPLGVDHSDVDAMRKHGAHIWKDVSRSQTFWCFCTSGKDHQSNPRWA